MAVVGPVSVEAVRPVASKARRGNSAKRLTIHVGTIVHSVVPKGARAASSEDGVGGFAGRCRERFEVGEVKVARVRIGMAGKLCLERIHATCAVEKLVVVNMKNMRVSRR